MIKISKSILYRYTVEEDIANAIVHCFGTMLSYIGLIYLVYVASIRGGSDDIIAYSIYGSSLIFMFLMSTLYHSIFHDMTRSVFKRLDHCAIFILITGTYTPIVISLLQTRIAYITLILLYIIAIAGIVFKTLFISKFKVLSTLLYVIMGWTVIFQIKDLIANLDINALILLILGGALYTIGAVIYAFSNFKFHHLIWHIFVLLAAISHYFVVALYIL
ncbi:MAG: PAQR family membrane homeostasis protein TrhA [Bacilli bacterium]